MEVSLRRLHEADSFVTLTELVHRAYGQLAQLGFRFMATHQGPEITRDRCLSGTCLVAIVGKEIVGTVTFYDCAQTGGCTWYDRPDVASFGQFAVEPRLQRRGIGSLMLREVEDLAWSTGAGELALDTAEGATNLIDYYARKGYRNVGVADWDETNYASVVMSKANPRG